MLLLSRKKILGGNKTKGFNKSKFVPIIAITEEATKNVTAILWSKIVVKDVSVICVCVMIKANLFQS